MRLSEPTQKSTWQTPPPLLDAVRAAGVRVELDPATAPDNPTRAKYFFSPEAPRADVEGRWLGHDGLSAAWPHVPLFSNPPALTPMRYRQPSGSRPTSSAGAV